MSTAMLPKDINTPIWQLTIGEFMELLNEQKQESTAEVKYDDQKYVYGLAGIASLFGVSKVTAWKIKSSGKIDKAISQTGRTIVTDRELALKLIQKND